VPCNPGNRRELAAHTPISVLTHRLRLVCEHRSRCVTAAGRQHLPGRVRAQPSERAGLLSTIHLISYCGAALPGLLAGQLTTTFGMLEIAAGIAALSALAALVSLATTPARPDPR
jgi:hypothetical protein